MICFYTDSFCLILLSCIDLLKSLIFCLKTFFEELLILNWTHCFTLTLRRIEANWTCRSCLFDLSLYFWYGLLKYCSLMFFCLFSLNLETTFFLFFFIDFYFNCQLYCLHFSKISFFLAQICLTVILNFDF